MKYFDKFNFPTVGLRMIKSAIVIFLSLSLSLLRNGHGTPFYVAIAALLCIQPTMESSKQAGIGRLFGTFLGGFWGSIALYIELYLFKDIHIIYTYLFVSVAIIPVIYSAVALKKNSAVFMSCVVFLSITISSIGDVNPFIFVLNRMFDTFLGTVIAISVNFFYLPEKSVDE
ncbi:MAG: FUSC family protein [Oscillospiraceae bacterium]